MLDQKFWEKYFIAYDILNQAKPYQSLLSEIISRADPKIGQLALDAGSGTGNLCLRLEERGIKVTGLDYSKAGIKLHKSKNHRANIVYGDLNKTLPFPGEYFDLIVSNNVIYTLPKNIRPKIYKEFYRILKPGGRIVVSNIHQGFRPMNIFISHIKQSLKEKGLINTFFDIIKFVLPIFKMFYYNHLIQKENRFGNYSLMEENEQINLMRQAGFQSEGKTISVYADQAYLDVGKKI
jgi:ubiquinone/menaquinone biosynthesis C-methylase UbiE